MGTFSVPRYAVYYSPASDGALWRFGSAVLGYDGFSGTEVPQLVPPGFDLASWRALTAEPRAYGFHATIKAPFRLSEGKSEATLIAMLTDFAASQSVFDLPSLQVSALDARSGEGAFIALLEPETTPALVALERGTMLALEPCRAPLTDKEFNRRRPDTLTDRQRACLNAYGYPYVLEDFRFHMTLTDRVPEERVEAALSGLKALYSEHVGNPGVPIDALTLFKQEAGANRFKVLARAPLGNGVTE
ncbi:DUF1045 domain-containing protein [Pseudochelatococcus sp. G4_1912]|uniref:DUF1045 domain-containing protein n=1 Tax=Pseudochelatococcus sp. G4_1912 TaxID=3114288 RepID=UPI0039C66B24